MLASVTLSFQAARSEGRQDFWKSFEQSDPQWVTKVDVIPSEAISSAISYERRFEAGFPAKLQELINEDPQHIWKKKPEGRGTTKEPSPVTIRLVSLQYGSIKTILEILENDDFRNFAILALQIYSPLAFQQALGTTALPSAYAEVLAGGPAAPATYAGRLAAFVNPNFAIAVTSLLIPVAFVLWFLMHELDAVHTEAAGVRTERIEIIKALVDQNKSISASLVAKGSTVSAKAVEDLLSSLVRKFVERPPAPNSDIAALTTSVNGLATSVNGIKTEIEKLSARVTKLEQAPPPPPPMPSNCEANVKSADCTRLQEALYRRVRLPTDPKNPGPMWNDGYGGPATTKAVKTYLRSIGEPEAEYLTPDQLRRLLSL